MNTKYSNWKMWYYVLCMVLTLQLAACSEETHDGFFVKFGGTSSIVNK